MRHSPDQLRAASREVFFPSAFAGRAALSRAAKPRDDPASTFGLHATPPRVGVRQKAWSLRFFASCQSCAARAAGITIHTGRHGSFAAVSLFARRSATRFRRPVTTGPDLLRFRSGSAPGIWHPSQYSSPAGPGVCFRRSSPHAVCRSFNTAAFYGCRPPNLNSFRASRARYGQLPNDRSSASGS